MNNEANIEKGVEICKMLYLELKPNVFPALTGGALYKSGKRKDIDIVLYGNRSNGTFEVEQIIPKLITLGFSHFEEFGYVTKCKYQGIDIDFLNPETEIEVDYGDI